MPGMNRKGAGGGAKKGRSGGSCEQAGDALSRGQGMGQRGEGGQGACRKPQGGGRGQGLGRNGACRLQPATGGAMPANPVAAPTSATGSTAGRKIDPNQQALDEIMDAVRQMEMRPKGER